MSVQHLSDEAVAAFADGVLGGHARDRATKHVDACAECRQAVAVQREAAWALRVAAAPSLPGDLASRLRMLPQTTTLSAMPTVVGPDGTPMLVSHPAGRAPVSRGSDPSMLFATPAAAGVVPVPGHRPAFRQVRPIATAAAVLALAGTLATGSVANAAQSERSTGGSPAGGSVRPAPAAGGATGNAGTGSTTVGVSPQQLVSTFVDVFRSPTGHHTGPGNASRFGR